MDCFIICIDYQLCAFMSQMNRLCFFYVLLYIDKSAIKTCFSLQS